MNKYYYGIDTRSGRSYCIESDIKDLNEWIRTWIDKKWHQFNHVSVWKNGAEDTDIIQFNSIVIRVDDIFSVCCCSKE